MSNSLADHSLKIKLATNLPNSAEFVYISSINGFPINRKTHVRPIGLSKFLSSFDRNMRVAEFLIELGRRLGAQVGARVELWVAGRRVDGRTKFASLV